MSDTKTGSAMPGIEHSPSAEKSTAAAEKNLDYLICRQCSTPCYVFEMSGDDVTEALCTVCGNEEIGEFAAGDIEEEG
jgi:hypothetical protein